MVWASPPWGRRERGFPLESNHARKKHHPRSTRHQRKTSTRHTVLAIGAREELRREMTPAEKLLWEELRANKLGVHFRRQQVIAGFIVDFYCHKAASVVEVDGDIHDLQKDEDERREKVLREMGLRIARFGNDEVVRELSAVVGRISELVSITT